MLRAAAIFATAAGYAGTSLATQAQTRGAEFPAPQSTQPASPSTPPNPAPATQTAAIGTLGVARAIPFDQMEARTNPSGGESRSIAHGTLATGERVNLHQSVQGAGQTPPSLHVIQHSEFILVREGELEFDHEVDGKIIAEKAGPGGVFYVAFGTRHVIKNVGSGPARYFVVAIGGDAK
jgi:mannose-6-phosphate isomerase-like protein (cupin superfamily)